MDQDQTRLIQRIIDLLPVGLFWKDQNYVYIGCNSIFAHDAGKSTVEEIIGKSDYELYPKERADRYRADDKNVIDNNKPKINFEEKRTLPSKEDHWISISKVPLTDHDGKIIGILGVYDDITEIKSAQQELGEKVETLERMNRLMVDRELKMIELKEQIAKLRG
jgi:PAS domain S-box-containing protein